MSTAAAMTTGKAFNTLAAVVVVVGAFLWLAALLGINDYWAGFLFLLQWSLMEQMRRERLPSSALGAAAGLAIAAIPVWTAPMVGTPASLGLLTLTALIATFAMIRGWAASVVNPATMLFLTVATIPQVAAGSSPAARYAGLAAGVVFFGGLALVAGAFVRTQTEPTAGAD